MYAISNLDGLTEAMVAARTIGEAALALGMSVRDMRKLDWRRVKGSAAAIALETPGQPFYPSIQGGNPGRWQSDRAEVLSTAARSALRGKRY